MTEEIKNILDDLGNKDNYIEEFDYQYKRISLYDSFQLLDYITNLQQENEKLKYNARGQVNDYFKDKYADEVLNNAELKKENEELKEWNKKLIRDDLEYVNKSFEQNNYKSRCENASIILNNIYLLDDVTITNNAVIEIDKAINILNGVDEND